MSETSGVIYQASLKESGFAVVWIPPCCRAAGHPTSKGYDVFDLSELETPLRAQFRKTKCGTHPPLLELIGSTPQS